MTRVLSVLVLALIAVPSEARERRSSCQPCQSAPVRQATCQACPQAVPQVAAAPVSQTTTAVPVAAPTCRIVNGRMVCPQK